MQVSQLPTAIAFSHGLGPKTDVAQLRSYGGSRQEKRHRHAAAAMANCRFKLVMAHLCRCVSLPARQRQPACRRRGQLDLSCRLGAEGDDGLQVLWEDGERVLCRGWRLDADGNRTAVLAMLPA